MSLLPCSYRDVGLSADGSLPNAAVLDSLLNVTAVQSAGQQGDTCCVPCVTALIAG